MRYATLEQDYWELRNAEDWHANYPDTFWIPDLEERNNLKVGNAARLIFNIEFENEDGTLAVGGERMNVVVREIRGNGYIGLLDDQPVYVEPSEDFYLCFGTEIPFGPEHVIDISQPPDNIKEVILSIKPKRLWPRD